MRKYMLLLVTVVSCLVTAAHILPVAGFAHESSAGARGASLQLEASFNKQEKWWDKVWPRPIGQ